MVGQHDAGGITTRLDAWFGIGRAGSTVVHEVGGGLTTFLTMSYIAVVNPVFLTAAGMPLDGVILATLLASAFATVLMGLAVNVPVALAPGMGLNAFFAYTICVNHGVPWRTGLGLLALAGMKLAAGRWREVHWPVFAVALLFIWRCLAIPLSGRRPAHRRKRNRRDLRFTASFPSP